MAGLTAANYKLNVKNYNWRNNNNNAAAPSAAAAAAAPAPAVAGACPPALGANDPLPAGYVAFVRAQIAARNAQRPAGSAPTGGGCGGQRRQCICSGLGCDDLWAQWVAIGCPDAPAGAAAAPAAAAAASWSSAETTHPGVMGNEETFGLAGNFGNNNNNNNNNSNSNSRSENSFTKASRLEWEQIQREEEERKKRRRTRRRRANRRSRRNNRTRSRR